ncbi:MAG: DUF4810 domain-containing protein [Gammaproteobacteria bacterium]|nr:DUF4810 domain-containing protein [Gammaproteobacteria bacterium]
MRKHNRALRCGLAVVLLVSLAACTTRPSIYSWGGYENVVYNTYNDPGKTPPEAAIEQMERDYQRARAQNKPAHPGFHAQLGYLYYQVGKVDAARQEFATEKANFPESAVFMDRLIANLQKK